MVRTANKVKSFTIPALGIVEIPNGKLTIKDGKLTLEIELSPSEPTFDKTTGVGRKNWLYASTRGNVGLGNGMYLGLNLYGCAPKDLGK